MAMSGDWIHCPPTGGERFIDFSRRVLEWVEGAFRQGSLSKGRKCSFCRPQRADSVPDMPFFGNGYVEYMAFGNSAGGLYLL